jgi:hypothetical protein
MNIADVGFTLLAGFHSTFSFLVLISKLWDLIIWFAQFILNDHVLALGRLGLIHAHQNLLVHELDHANEEWVRVKLHVASIT